MVVDALVQPAGLVRGGLGGQSGYERQTPGGQRPAQPGQKSGVILPILCPDIFKVHVHPLVAPAVHGADDPSDELPLVLLVLQQFMGQLGGEALLLIQIGQVEDGDHPALEGGVHQGFVPERDQFPLVKSVGKGCNLRQVGQGGPEQIPVDVGVCVGVDGKGPPGPGGVFYHDDLSGVDQVPALKGGVVAQQLGYRGVVHLGDGVQRVPRPDGVGQLRVLDHDGLSHHQLGGVFQLVVLEQPLHRDAVLLGQPVHGVARLDDMDVHRFTSFQTTVTNSLLA